MKPRPLFVWAVGLWILFGPYGWTVESTGPSVPPSSGDATETAAVMAVSETILSSTEDINFLSEIQSRMDGLSDASVMESAGPSRPRNALPGMEGSVLFQTFFWLMVVVLLLLVVAAIARRLLGPRLGLPGQDVRLISSLPVSAKSKLHVVQVEHQRFLVGEGGGQLTLIAALGETQAVEQEENELIADGEEGEREPNESGFSARVQSWQQHLGAQGLSREVHSSLLLIDALARRLRSRKGATTPE